MIKKFADFLKDNSLDIEYDKRKDIISKYLYSLCQYLHNIMDRIEYVRNYIESYDFLEFSDLDIDSENQNIILKRAKELKEIQFII